MRFKNRNRPRHTKKVRGSLSKWTIGALFRSHAELIQMVRVLQSERLTT